MFLVSNSIFDMSGWAEERYGINFRSDRGSKNMETSDSMTTLESAILAASWLVTREEVSECCTSIE